MAWTAKVRSFPYKWTCLIGMVWLISDLWWTTFRDGNGFGLSLVLLSCFFVSVVVSLVRAALDRRKESLYRILINVAFCLLFFPSARLGSFLRDRLFLHHLPRFQEVTDRLISEEQAKSGADHTAMANLPATYSDLNVSPRVFVILAKQHVTVRFATRDSFSLGHAGYMYRSDDDPAVLEKEFPHYGYKRLAPHWFFFVD